MRTDKEQAQLTGPVRTVRSEMAAGMADLSGARVEGAPQLESVLTYDLNGHLIEAIPGQPQGSNPAKVLYRYDTQGLRYEAVRFSADGRLLSRSVYVYTYDARGNPTELIPYHSGSFTEEVISRLVYLYDEQGHLKEMDTYDAWGGKMGRERYDAQGRLVEAATLYANPPESIRSQVTYTYQADGSSTSSAYEAHGPGLGFGDDISTYDTNGTLLDNTQYFILKAGLEEEAEEQVPPPRKTLYSYEWDSHGNWLKQRATVCTVQDDGTLSGCASSWVRSRTITYYEQ